MVEPRMLTAPDGARLAWWVRGRGPAMLIHHGLLSSDLHFRHFTPHFQRRFMVIHWDYPGHGASPPPLDPAVVTIGSFADQAHAVLGEAARGAAAVVCGLSMGVQSALEQLRRHPTDVRALVLLCGTAGHPLDRVSRSPLVREVVSRALRVLGGRGGALQAITSRALRSALAREVAYLVGGASRGPLSRELLGELLAHVASVRPEVMVAALGSYLSHDASEVLPRIEVPTLIVAGEHDALVPPAVAEAMHARIRGSSLHIARGRSHVAQLEAPDEVHGVVERFLSQHHLDAVPPGPPGAPRLLN